MSRQHKSIRTVTTSAATVAASAHMYSCSRCMHGYAADMHMLMLMSTTRPATFSLDAAGGAASATPTAAPRRQTKTQ